MRKLKMIAATLAAAVAAMGLSVGAALAEGEQQQPVKFGADGQPQHVCIFHKIL